MPLCGRVFIYKKLYRRGIFYGKRISSFADSKRGKQHIKHGNGYVQEKKYSTQKRSCFCISILKYLDGDVEEMLDYKA